MKTTVMDTTAALQQLGFTEYEARAYAALVSAGELNGYELAKKTGIPRANIYAVAGKLVDRGAILRSDHEGGQRYTPVPPRQLLRALEAHHQRALDAAEQALSHQAQQQDAAPVSNLRGDELLTRARQIIDSCHDSLLIALQPSEAAALAAPLQSAADRGAHITTLCMEACDHECGGCQGTIHRYAIAPEDQRWLILVADGHTTLIGQTGQNAAEGMTTHQMVTSRLAMAFIRQNIALATLSEALGDQIFDSLSQSAQSRLDELYPDGGFPAFLQGLTARSPD